MLQIGYLIQLLLSHIDLPLVHEVEHGEELPVLDPLEVEERVFVRVAP